MKKKLCYWGMVIVLGFVHLQALLANLPWTIPFYITCIIVLGAGYYFFKTIHLSLSSLSLAWNGTLFCLQILLLVIYLMVRPSWVYLVPFIVFLGLEMVRLNVAKKLASITHGLQLLQGQTEHFNETFRIVRSERHDFLKHVSAIHFMLENGTYGEAKMYLDNLVDGYEETNLSIKGERGAVAGVLHQMYRRAKENGISLVYDFDLPLSTLPLSDQDAVALLGNLLTNSIDASEEWQKERGDQAVITLQFYKRSGLYLLVCKNNSLPVPTKVLDSLFESFGKTTKEGHEGLGTKIIYDIVQSHQGFLDFVHKDEEFTVKMKFPAIQP
ncbi:sensor histidine kinase [Neobacillus dielmonensis]|uniref:sensor histidine kinase n=1 Tax=Neobacillus dielmonensis TaxID=1347369 RepID=UPI00069507FA|nr:GHKL domain-containing protein [Neobacillus dielmonensis]